MRARVGEEMGYTCGNSEMEGSWGWWPYMSGDATYEMDDTIAVEGVWKMLAKELL
jgi:hypothetical protein